MVVSLERLIERYIPEDDEGLFNADEARNSLVQFTYFLNGNREKTLTEVCEMLAKPGAYEDILPSFVILAQVLLTIPTLLLCLVKGDFQHKTEFMEL